jgi:hypothetical protein
LSRIDKHGNHAIEERARSISEMTGVQIAHGRDKRNAQTALPPPAGSAWTQVH